MIEIYSAISQYIYKILEIIGYEILIAAIFTVDEHKGIKWTFGSLFGSEYKKTSLYVSIVLILAITYSSLCDQVRDPVVSMLIATKLKSIPLLFASLSFAVFWLTKVIIGRKWDFELVRLSLFVFISSLLIFFFAPI